jgi:hypothetical protein
LPGEGVALLHVLTSISSRQIDETPWRGWPGLTSNYLDITSS